MSRSPAPSTALAGALAERLLDPGRARRLKDVEFRDAGHGFDPFGMHPAWVALGAGLCRPLHDSWFRVTAHGREHIPREGAVILAANHSGTLPFDAAMLWADVVLEVGRVPRPVGDVFVPAMPFVGTLFARAGMVGGSRGNVRALLREGEMLMVFPEGVPGIGKPFSERYRLQAWRVGHAELAIRHRAPVVPVAIVGAEEQMPQVARMERLGRWMGLPYVPVPLVPFPLPVHYHVWYGDPIRLYEDLAPEAADDPEVVREAAARVKRAVDALLHRGLEERRGIFR